MVDLLKYLKGDITPGQTAGRPVGITQQPGGDAIYQVQLDAPNSRRFLQVKGSFGATCDWEELMYDDTYIYRAIDVSRKQSEGGPYTLYDAAGVRGSKWARRHMNVGDVFMRNPFVAAFDIQTGTHTKVDGPVKTWLRFASHHTTWRDIQDVIELWWLVNSPNDTAPAERYFYKYGLIGFEGSGMKAYPNHVWDKLPPAANVPVLSRKPIGFPLPALPEATPAPSPSGFTIVNPARFPHTVYSTYGWRDSPGKPGQRDFHGGVDLTPSQPAPHPVHAAAPGRVVYAGEDASSPGMANYGKRVDIEHDDGMMTRYAHLDTVLVRAGDYALSADKQIGTAGKTGWATGIHLHFEVRKDGLTVDPMPFLNAPPPVIPEPAPDPDDTTPTPAEPMPPVVVPFMPLELEFATPEQKNQFAALCIAFGEAVKAAPGRMVYLSVSDKKE